MLTNGDAAVDYGISRKVSIDWKLLIIWVLEYKAPRCNWNRTKSWIISQNSYCSHSQYSSIEGSMNRWEKYMGKIRANATFLWLMIRLMFLSIKCSWVFIPMDSFGNRACPWSKWWQKKKSVLIICFLRCRSSALKIVEDGFLLFYGNHVTVMHLQLI